MENKSYKGKRRCTARSIIAFCFVLAGAFFLFGGVGAIEHDTVSLGVGLFEMLGGMASFVIGLRIGRVI